MTSHAVLTSEEHRDLRVRQDRDVALGDGVMACITVPFEFRRVQNEYPILFRLSDERDSFTAMALFGFENGENLFLDGGGGWDARYLPLAIDVQPFLIGLPAPGAEDRQVHIDLSSPRIGGEEGMRLFDEFGRPTPFMEATAEKLGELDVGYRASDAFFDAMRRHELLEPFTLEVTLDDSSTNRLVGFHIVDEDRVRALDASALGELHDEGHLMPMFMALASLSNLDALIARKNRRLRDG